MDGRLKKREVERILNIKSTKSYSTADAFNFWRKKMWKDGPSLDLRNMSIIGADLKGINLEGANLPNASLTCANLERANLRRVSFNYTFADRANFRNADLRDCEYLYKLDADEANFEGADLRGANLKNQESYVKIVKRLLANAHFKNTKITPRQKIQLMTEFGVPAEYFTGRFKVIPRKEYSPNEWQSKKAVKAYEKAKKDGRIFSEKLNGDILEYALIPVEGNEDLYNRFGYALSVCKIKMFLGTIFGSEHARSEGDWLYFVFDIVPERFREFFAVHEFGEREGGSHKEAMRMEYERAKSRSMLNEYISWRVENHPDGLIGNLLFVEGAEKVLPTEVIEATKAIMPENIEAWKEEQLQRKQGLPVDIWVLAWRMGGLTDRQISGKLNEKGYDVSPRVVRYYREKMEIPDYRAIKKLTYLEPPGMV